MSLQLYATLDAPKMNTFEVKIETRAIYQKDEARGRISVPFGHPKNSVQAPPCALDLAFIAVSRDWL